MGVLSLNLKSIGKKLPKIPSFIFSLTILIFFLLTSLKYATKINEPQTVIGILTQASYFPEQHSPDSFHYIGACYVNQLRVVGANVVPIIITKTDQEITSLLSKINGVVIPGGDLDLFDTNTTSGYDRFTQVTQLIFTYSLKLWEQNSTIFPVWGTCQGFESLLIVVSQMKSYNDILEEFNNFNVSENISINQNIESRMFSEMSQEQLEYSQNGSPFFYWHFYGISPQKFNSIHRLTKYFDITSTSVNKNGKEFVATFEGKMGIPIYASQFHPERVFVWLPNRLFTSQIIFVFIRAINHLPMAFETNQYFARFFINQARQNFNSFESEEELREQLIEFNSYSLEKVSKAFMFCYFFKID